MEVSNLATEITKTPVTMSIDKAHAVIAAHADEAATRTAAAHIGIIITRGSMSVCTACTEAKAKQMHIPVHIEHVVASADARRIHLDLSSIKAPKGIPRIGKPFWQMMVDDRTGYKVSMFHEKKSDMVEPTCELLYRWQQNNIPVKYICADNAGENKSLQQTAQGARWKLNLKFEFTAANTPQQNSLVEVGFATITNRGRALMMAAHVPLVDRYLLWREAFQMATICDHHIPI